jgi:Fe-S cluster assembly iron-binding protein IscA
MVKVTDIAAIKLKELINKKKNPDATMLRISFGGFG